MKKHGNLMSVRKDIRVLDATLRDGGLVNNFGFSDEFVKALYNANVKAGVDYMEFGYKASKELFDPQKFGKWKFCDEDDLRKIVGENDTHTKIAVMADVGRTDFRHDIVDKSESVIDMVRVATYINTIPAAMEIIEYCKERGYETTCNIMAVSTAAEKDVEQALDYLGECGVDVVYIVDSYGSYYPEQMRELSERYLEKMDKHGYRIGIHAHNNQQLAFANTIEAVASGVSYLDATMNGIGRGAGNCNMESLLGFLKNPKYNLIPALDFIEKQMLPLKKEGVVWGYDIPYQITGLLNLHPKSAIDAIKNNDTDYVDFYTNLWDREC